MKGFMFALGGDAKPTDIMATGLHGVWQPGPFGRDQVPRDWRVSEWSTPQLETFADYATMREGDRVFFFKDRLVYGIGRMISRGGSGHSAFINYSGASSPSPSNPDPGASLIGPARDSEWRRVRVAVPFAPDPQFFSQGLDMDEVLAAPGAEVAWGLRFFEGRSFAQLGEAETRLLIGAFERRFANAAGGPDAFRIQGVEANDVVRHLEDCNATAFSMTEFVRVNADSLVRGSEVRNEATLHGLLVDAANDPGSLLYSPDRRDSFHELPASPPKPPKYADAMDVVATSAYPGRARDERASAVHFDVIEAKKDRLTGRGEDAFDRAVAQLMKYVDFITVNYAGGNYSAVDAFFVAHGYSDPIAHRYVDASREVVGVTSRSYVLSPHETPATRIWSRLRLLTYRWSDDVGRLELRDVSVGSP